MAHVFNIHFKGSVFCSFNGETCYRFHDIFNNYLMQTVLHARRVGKQPRVVPRRNYPSTIDHTHNDVI